MSLSLLSVVVVMVRFVGVAFQALIVVLLANAIPVADMGLFSAVYLFWGLTRALGPFGMDQLSMRDIATFVGVDDRRAQAVANFAFIVVAAVGLAVAVLAFAALYVASSGGTEHYTLSAVAAAALGAPAYALNGLMVAQLRGFGRTLQSQISESITLHALSLGVMALLAGQGRLTLETALITQAGAAWVVLAIYLALRLRCGIDLTAGLAAGQRRRAIADAFQIFQAQSLSAVRDRVPTYLGLGLLGPAGAAIIDIANRFGTLPYIFTEGVAATFAPIYARLHAAKQADDYRATLTLSSWLAFLPAFGALLFLLVAGPWLLDTFFPDAYAAAYWPIVLICTATVFNAGFGLASSTFIVTGRQTVVRRYTGYSLLVVVVAGLVLGWFFGAVGIAIAILAASIVRDAGMARLLAGEIGGPVMLDLALPRRLVHARFRAAAQ